MVNEQIKDKTMEFRTDEEIKEEIAKLKATLKGDIFSDGDIMQEIYELKLILNPRIALHPDEDDDDDICEACGS